MGVRHTLGEVPKHCLIKATHLRLGQSNARLIELMSHEIHFVTIYRPPGEPGLWSGIHRLSSHFLQYFESQHIRARVFKID